MIDPAFALFRAPSSDTASRAANRLENILQNYLRLNAAIAKFVFRMLRMIFQTQF
jgi:hypothetical protein